MHINDGKLNFQNILLSEDIDKSSLISYTNKSLCSPSTKFLCVSRPRRFGKSYTANMLAAYYSKGCDSHDLFSKLEISKEESYEKYINKFNVITLDIQSMIALNQGAKGVVSYIQKSVCKELADEFSDIHFSKDNLVEAILNIFNKTNEKFVFILGEYDCLFRDYPNEKEEVKAYLNLLRGLFKGAIGDRAVALAYMTGIFPIGRYDTQPALNNFDQISMLNTFRLGKFVGFTG